jgi:hypothetical protein
VVAEMIWPHQGSAHPIALKFIAKAIGKTERAVKGIVEQLVVTHRMRIGARREEPVGYFVVVTAEDLDIACKAYESQIFSMWRRLRVLRQPHHLRDLLGQLRIEEGADGDRSRAGV